MNDQSQLLLRAIRGPVIMITVGVLFAADRFTDYHFHETWPVLLIVVGLMQLFGGRRRKADYYPPPGTPGVHPMYTAPAPPPPPPPPSSGPRNDNEEVGS